MNDPVKLADLPFEGLFNQKEVPDWLT